MPIDTTDTSMTTRQKFEAHVNEPSCAACHSTFDPIGFGMEDMDGIGRFRSTENGKPVDSSGALSNTDVDGPFEGPAALSMKLAQSQQLASCMVEHFFSFAQAREPETADECVGSVVERQVCAGRWAHQQPDRCYVADRTFAYRKDDR